MSLQTVKQEFAQPLTADPFPPQQVNGALSDKKQKPSKKAVGSNLKTIRAPGSRSDRVAQACDRCRAKKTKCDGGDPCSTCSAVGLKCIVSDKLSRKAFPKGYTETLEERVRHLEAEIKRLVGILDMRDEQLELLGGPNNHASLNDSKSNVEQREDHKITTSNLNLLDQENKMHLHSHDANGCSCGCDHSHAVHERPVSVAGSLYEAPPLSIASSVKISDDEDFDTNSLLSFEDTPSTPVQSGRRHYASNSSNRDSTPAPGAFAAATAIAQMQRKRIYEQQQHHQQQQEQQQQSETNKQRMLTSLVATSLPRSTEETLCVPTLLARICQAYGYDSKPSILTANTLATLKDHSTHKSPFGQGIHDRVFNLLMSRDDVMKLNKDEAVIFLRDIVQFPVSRLDIDQLLTVYFQQWGNAMPILDKSTFLKSYVEVMQIMETGSVSVEDDGLVSESIEKVGALMVLLLSLGLLASKNVYLKSDNAQNYVSLMKHYDMLIHEFIKPNCLITKHCSIQSLQVLSLALQYCLAIGDISTCYDLRGRVISMAQQLRLHRCPAAILGLDVNEKSDLNSRNFMQGERRILFWCIYCLDTYCSLNLGVPRLMKDYEIECAMPFSGKGNESDSENGEDDDNVNILIVNNTELTIVGKVSKMALSVMLFCKVLASILDSIYSRFDNGEDANRKALHKDRMLDCWRRELPADLKFDVDVSGLSLSTTDTKYYQGSVWENCNTQQSTLIYLYYHARILIYLPIVSKFGNHHNVGLSQKDQLNKGESDTTTIVSAMSLIHQSSSQILQVIKASATSSSSSVLPIPLNIAREQSLLTMLVAKGTLDYIKGGPLYNNSKQLLLDSVAGIANDAKYETPDCLNKNSVKLLELSIMSILGINLNKFSDNLKKKTSAAPIQKTAVEREPKLAAAKPYAQFVSNMKQQQNADFAHGEPKFRTSVDTNNNFSAQGTQDVDLYGNLDDLESLLKFDPFSINVHDSMHVNEFVTDGSLGFGPYLELSNTGNLDLDNNHLFNNFPNYHHPSQ
ncbi:CAT8 [Candida margitis]|uniref:CAT8 n=1 Tax=Candida margitis TaxID=1775924 RepID=UPI002225FE5C|nr:CAT8 [Candida margitis]KAI5950417.1 CAT8 [Candida margitis]